MKLTKDETIKKIEKITKNKEKLETILEGNDEGEELNLIQRREKSLMKNVTWGWMLTNSKI